MEIAADFIFLGSKITVDSDCSHEIKTLASWKESYDKPRQHIKKQIYHFADKHSYSQSYGFSSSCVQMLELDHEEGRAPKNWCFQTGTAEDLRVPWIKRRSNQSILKEINPEYSLEGLMLRLQYFGHLILRANSLEKTLMLGMAEGKRRGQQRMRWLDSTSNSMDMNLSEFQETLEDRGAWCAAAVHGVAKRWTCLGNSTKRTHLLQF